MASGEDQKDELASELASEFDALAAEYVVGTLDAAERVAFEARLGTSPALARAVRQWQARLAPLDAATSPVEPPAEQFDKIISRLDVLDRLDRLDRLDGGDHSSTVGEGAEIIQLKRQARIWRGATISTGSIAAALALFMLFTDIPGSLIGLDGGPEMVAVLESPDRKVVYVASANGKTGKVVVKRLGAGPAPGKAHELWAIGGGRDKPQSLGVIARRAEIPVNRIGPATAPYLGGITLAVSLEPEGGSPTGQPTGPVLFTGKFVALPAS